MHHKEEGKFRGLSGRHPPGGTGHAGGRPLPSPPGAPALPSPWGTLSGVSCKGSGKNRSKCSQLCLQNLPQFLPFSAPSSTSTWSSPIIAHGDQCSHFLPSPPQSVLPLKPEPSAHSPPVLPPPWGKSPSPPLTP